MKHLSSILLFLLLVAAVKAQAPEDYPKDYFRPPMNIPMSFSGTYAEVRSNHFHSGIDLRTGGEIGQPVYAAAEGYLARVAISAWGGGKVLYIDHPNGLRTVYMHLNDFCGRVGEWIKQVQYAQHTFALDTTLPKGLISIKAGDLIAHSGNSGSSGGPHLHFEIRYADNDQTINPLYFGFAYTDKVRPTIRGIRLYPAAPNTAIEGANKPIALGNRDTIAVSGAFYLGIYAIDPSELSGGKNGIEKIELLVDGERYWRYHVPSFRFEDTRCINALIDYPLYQKSREYYLLTRRLKGVSTDFSLPLNGGTGLLLFNDSKIHKLTYTVSDTKGNRVERSFYVKAGSGTLSTSSAPTPQGTAINYRKATLVEANNLKAELRAYTLYDDDIMLHSTRSDSRYLSPIHTLQPASLNLPPHKGYKLSLSIPKLVKPQHYSKLVLVSLNSKGSPSAQTSSTNGTWVVANNVRTFGDFALMLDTIAPKVRAANFVEGKSIKGKRLQIKVSDNLAGLQTYHCYLNGEWILAEYDGKTASLYINTTGKLRQGDNKLRCIAVDAKGNRTDVTWNRLKN